MFLDIQRGREGGEGGQGRTNESPGTDRVISGPDGAHTHTQPHTRTWQLYD